MKFTKLPLGIRLGLAPFRVILFIACMIVAVFLEFAGETEKAERLMNWAQAS